jgi:hypothetical protein
VTQQAEEPNDIGRNVLLGNRKEIAKFLMRTFTCRSTFLYDVGSIAVRTDVHKEYIIYNIKYRYLWGSSSKLNKIAAIRQTREETPDVFTKYV